MNKLRFAFSFPKFDPKVNYYQQLGVSKQSNVQEIKEQYYKLAKQYHPDVSADNVDKFKQINEAYQILGDESIKSLYDQSIQSGGGTIKSPGSTSRPNSTYHYGRQQQNFHTHYEQFKRDQQQYTYQYENTQNNKDGNSEYSRFERQQYSRQRSQHNIDGTFIKMLILFLMGMTSYVVFDIFHSLTNSRSIVMYDEQTGDVLVTSPNEFKRVQSNIQMRSDVQSAKMDMMKQRQIELRKQRQRDLMN